MPSLCLSWLFRWGWNVCRSLWNHQFDECRPVLPEIWWTQQTLTGRKSNSYSTRCHPRLGVPACRASATRHVFCFTRVLGHILNTLKVQVGGRGAAARGTEETEPECEQSSLHEAAGPLIAAPRPHERCPLSAAIWPAGKSEPPETRPNPPPPLTTQAFPRVGEINKPHTNIQGALQQEETKLLDTQKFGWYLGQKGPKNKKQFHL